MSESKNDKAQSHDKHQRPKPTTENSGAVGTRLQPLIKKGLAERCKDGRGGKVNVEKSVLVQRKGGGRMRARVDFTMKQRVTI